MARDLALGQVDAAAVTPSPGGAGPMRGLLRRSVSAPVALLIPLVAAGLTFVIAVITSQVAIGVAERTQHAAIERLGDVYLDGLSALTQPFLVAGEIDGLVAALRRMKAYHEGIRDLRIVVRSMEGRIVAEAAREGAGGSPPPAIDTPRDDRDRFADGRYWIQRILVAEGRPLAVLSAELDSGDVLAERQRARVFILGVDIALSLLLALLAYAVLRSVLRPLARLERALLAAHDGHLAPIVGPDLPADGNEFGRLLRAYNAMIEAVEERERLRERLGDQQRVADLGRLAATIAHEVRNPVAGMLAAVDTARRFGQDPEAVRMSLDLVERGLRNIGQVVDATLSIYRPGGEARDLLPEDFEDLRLLAAPAARRRGIALDWDVGLVEAFAVDAGPLRQILLNLLLNAASATPRGGVVALSVRLDDGVLRLDVSDGGAGMPEDQRRRFAAAATAGGTDDAMSTHVDEGGGLGIDVILRLLRDLDGTIDIASASGTGTRIVLRIPSRADASPR
jgi:two-component system OmpR family sensor kinase